MSYVNDWIASCTQHIAYTHTPYTIAFVCMRIKHNVDFIIFFSASIIQLVYRSALSCYCFCFSFLSFLFRSPFDIRVLSSKNFGSAWVYYMILCMAIVFLFCFFRLVFALSRSLSLHAMHVSMTFCRCYWIVVSVFSFRFVSFGFDSCSSFFHDKNMAYLLEICAPFLAFIPLENHQRQHKTWI